MLPGVVRTRYETLKGYFGAWWGALGQRRGAGGDLERCSQRLFTAQPSVTRGRVKAAVVAPRAGGVVERAGEAVGMMSIGVGGDGAHTGRYRSVIP